MPPELKPIVYQGKDRGTDESGCATDMGDKICNLIAKATVAASRHMFKGFFLASGALLAYGLYNYLVLIYMWG